MTRPGGNFTQPDHDYTTGQVTYRVYVAWQRQPEKYETAQEAEAALRNAMKPAPLAFLPHRRQEAG